MKYSFLYEKSAFCLPGGAVDSLKKASHTDLKILVALGSGRFSSEDDIASFLGISPLLVERSLEFWRGAGVLIPEEGENSVRSGRNDFSGKIVSADEIGRNTYTSSEITAICEKDSAVLSLIDECQKILGKTFTKTEISSVVYIYDHLRLDGEYIMMLCTYCKSRDKTSIRYVEKMAVSLYDNGVDSVASLDAYIKNEQKKLDAEYKIRVLFGIGERSLTTKEKTFLDKWIKLWDMPFEIIEKAYEVMVEAKIEPPTFAYENGILEKWHEAGVKTLADAEEQLNAHKKSGKKNKNANKASFDLDEFFELAVKRGAGRAEGIKTEK